jgi:hypothetical protein
MRRAQPQPDRARAHAPRPHTDATRPHCMQHMHFVNPVTFQERDRPQMTMATDPPRKVKAIPSQEARNFRIEPTPGETDRRKGSDPPRVAAQVTPAREARAPRQPVLSRGGSAHDHYER